MNGHQTTRRQFVVAVGSVGAMLAIKTAQAQVAANPAAFGAAIGKVTHGAEVKKGRVKLDVPPLSENGNTVATNVTVESPMTAKDYVKAIHLFAEKNPQPNIISVHLGPRSGKAAISTRIRLADTQTVTAIAEMSDGSFWQDTGDVIITLGACLEDPV
ncbi:MAG: SoxY-related AACIE arm protein [Pseudomonadota bacterium]